jgi:hypothetical protein
MNQKTKQDKSQVKNIKKSCLRDSPLAKQKNR